ncbi:potassium-transporting ATPase subunit KdpA [Nakamurella endophytica]|uniref:Potassium-transporting ATPase potassium-binding subunit n=1 Tax=Nakamurella endophytica TaxID=1748367 RepID=A0A917T9K9_9ACTN|nr:potassium-transporting ATPase subunit KdpA [Nakamurella endophytica]GGM14986.1 potassium-transporting ATPase potassium-binding subunit [Nakamurella endophytica]
MSGGWVAAAQIATLVLVLALVHVPLGDHVARVLTPTRHSRVERGLYRVLRVDPEADQRWTVYALSVAAFSAVSVVVLWLLLSFQGHLGWANGTPDMPAAQGWNTAVSFVTNTNWQSYAGESALGYTVQAIGLTVQNFLSAAVGIAVVAALIRGLTRSRTDRLGNFWVDMTRLTLRLVLPLSFLAALVLVVSGVVQNLHAPQTFTTLAGGRQTVPGGLVASQEAVKELGTNGGGYYNANSAHPFENPDGFTNLFEIFLMLAIPFSLPRTFGRMVGSARQGLAIVAAMAVLYVGALATMLVVENAHPGAALQAAGGAMEGKETRFGIPLSALFAVSTTATSTGAVDSLHSSYTGLGGGVAMLNMLLGEISPGGTGSGLYGMLVLAVVTVFIGGLMVGRTPTYLGKQIGGRQMTFVASYLLATPAVVLLGLGVALLVPSARGAVLNGGPHALSEITYAFASAANNNGSAFAGLSANSDFYNVVLGFAMLVGRLLPIVLVLGLAGSLARQPVRPADSGTLPTHRPQFVVLLVAVVILVAGLTYLPALALGPIAEGLSA